MATYNTTYNYNQPNMNFGETLLYGALGSLTGGMGCGGYGMGMGSFGIGGSIFPMGTMMSGYNCYAGGGCYSADQATAVQVGGLLSNVLIGGLAQCFQGKGGNGKQTLASQIETVESDAKSHLETLGETSLKDFNPNKKASEYKAVSDLNDNVKGAEGKNNSAVKALEDAEKALRNKGLGVEHRPTKEEIENVLREECKGTNKTEEQIQQYIKDNYEKRSNDCDELYNNYKTAKQQEEEAKKALKEAEKVKEAKEKEIQAAINALKPLKESYDKLVEQQKKEQLEKDINDVDGNAINRTRKSKLEKEYTDNGNTWTRRATAEDIQGALAAYRKNPNEQTKWKDIIKAMVTHKDTIVPKKFKSVLESIFGSSIKINYEE